MARRHSGSTHAWEDALARLHEQAAGKAWGGQLGLQPRHGKANGAAAACLQRRESMVGPQWHRTVVGGGGSGGAKCGAVLRKRL